MNFSKQMKSLDRRVYFFRNKIKLLNTLYNHFARVNVQDSFFSLEKKSALLNKAYKAKEQLLLPTEVDNSSKHIPKIIWMYWHSGFDSAPPVVKLSVQSWQKMNPDYEVRLLCDSNLHDVLGFHFNDVFYASSVRCLFPTKADILRLHLLSRFGGVWVDATTFCLKPLTTWLPLASSICDLFNFKQKNNPTRPIEAWFIASPQGSAIINSVLRQYLEYITKPRLITLYISGKIPLLEKVLYDEEKSRPLEPAVSYRAEKFGFMPYFSVAYFFYQALKDNLSKQQLDIYLRQDTDIQLTNNYALTKDNFSEFENAYVSKQTYVNSYTSSELFKKRVTLLKQKLDDL